jgi:hypothetical protein
MHDPFMVKALKLERERDMNWRLELARQLRDVKAEHKLRRQRQLRSWVSSLVRCVFSPLAPPDTGAAVTVSRPVRRYGDQDSAGRLVVTCDGAREAGP